MDGIGTLEARVGALKGLIVSDQKLELPRRYFEGEVDALIDAFYDDIGSIKLISLRSLFDLFLIKVLYIERQGRDFNVLDYLSEMLSRFLLSRELIRFNNRYDLLSALLDEIKERQRFQNLFEASRHLADNALFVTGVFPTAQLGRRRFRRPAPPRFDREHFITLGRRYYQIAAEEQLAEVVGQRAVLTKLAEHFTYYMDALSEVSRRYILGFDMDVVANKMLDAMNLYRSTGDERHLDDARKYAALLHVDRSAGGLSRFRGAVILDNPPD